MSDITELVGRYLRAWNETDPAVRRATVDDVWAEDGTYVDPLGVAEGRDAIDAMIAGVRAQFAGLTFSLAGPVDAHHDIARFTWHLGPEGGEAIVIGFDVVVVNEDGRLASVLGFLDKVPA
jgi:hypothetical protein